MSRVVRTVAAGIVPGSSLVFISKQAGQVTSAQPGRPPAAYSGVSCGHLPQYAPAYTPSTG